MRKCKSTQGMSIGRLDTPVSISDSEELNFTGVQSDIIEFACCRILGCEISSKKVMLPEANSGEISMKVFGSSAVVEVVDRITGSMTEELAQVDWSWAGAND
jgi:hypothetical protein